MSSQTAIRIIASPYEVSAAQQYSDSCRRSETVDVLILCLSSRTPRGNAISKNRGFVLGRRSNSESTRSESWAHSTNVYLRLRHPFRNLMPTHATGSEAMFQSNCLST